MARINKSTSKKKQGNNGAALKSGIIILFLVALVVGYYYYLSNRQKKEESANIKVTAVQEVLARNLEINYPPTPREVIRYYSDITKCFYNEELSDEELEQLADRARMLYDEELVEKNEWGRYIIDLKSEIDYYQENAIRISSYSLASSTDVDFFSDSGFDFARIYCAYTLSSGRQKQTVEEVFLLRKDEDKHWRIYGWDLAENVHVEEQE